MATKTFFASRLSRFLQIVESRDLYKWRQREPQVSKGNSKGHPGILPNHNKIGLWGPMDAWSALGYVGSIHPRRQSPTIVLGESWASLCKDKTRNSGIL